MVDNIFASFFCCLSLLKHCLRPSSIIPNSDGTISFMTFVWNILSLPTWLDCRGISSQASFFLWRLPLACTVYRIQGWLVGAEFQESIEKKNRPNFRTPSLSLPDKLGNLRLWCFEHFSVRSCAHYDCGGGSREVNETKYKWKQREQIEQTLQ